MPPATQQPLLEALLVDRDRLIRMLRITLEELNIRRVTTPRCTGETDINEMLRFGRKSSAGSSNKLGRTSF